MERKVNVSYKLLCIFMSFLLILGTFSFCSFSSSASSFESENVAYAATNFPSRTSVDATVNFSGVTYDNQVTYWWRTYSKSTNEPYSWYEGNKMNQFNENEFVQFQFDLTSLDFPINSGAPFTFEFTYDLTPYSRIYENFSYPTLIFYNHDKSKGVTVPLTSWDNYRGVLKDYVCDFDIYTIYINFYLDNSSYDDSSVSDPYIEYIGAQLHSSVIYITESSSDSLLTNIANKLDSIIDMEGDSDLSDLDDSSVNNAISDEKDLLDKETEIDTALDVEYDSAGIGVIWDIIDTFVTGNPKVFALVITMLSLGVICLILNRR